ncbi:MAG: hypothetical protein JWM42_1784 [Burkholderia sp.]|nr:hypothetical protein [Burkholderia sp.]
MKMTIREQVAGVRLRTMPPAYRDAVVKDTNPEETMASSRWRTLRARAAKLSFLLAVAGALRRVGASGRPPGNTPRYDRQMNNLLLCGP